MVVDRIYTLTTFYRLEQDERFARRAIEELRAVAAFPDWNPSVFLDTAKMTHAAALGYDWLYHFMDESDRIRLCAAILDKGLRPISRPDIQARADRSLRTVKAGPGRLLGESRAGRIGYSVQNAYRSAFRR